MKPLLENTSLVVKGYYTINGKSVKVELLFFNPETKSIEESITVHSGGETMVILENYTRIGPGPEEWSSIENSFRLTPDVETIKLSPKETFKLVLDFGVFHMPTNDKLRIRLGGFPGSSNNSLIVPLKLNTNE